MGRGKRPWKGGADAMAAVGLEDFEAAVARTRKALEGLATHWESKGAVGAALASASRSVELGTEGHSWGRRTGLRFVLPSECCRCEATPELLARDGLSVSGVGGPPRPVHPALLVAPAPGCGFGVFTARAIDKGTVLGEYTGELRRFDVWLAEIQARKRAAGTAGGASGNVPFIPEELYAAWAGSGPEGAGVVVDGFAVGNPIRFVNCSCRPSVGFKLFGSGPEGHGRLEVVAERDIQAWEQLSVDYGWYHDQATFDDVRSEALAAYAEDRAALKGLLTAADASGSEACRVSAQAIATAARAGPPFGDDFLQRFVDPGEFVELHGLWLPEATDFGQIPMPLSRLYEVVGAMRVGIPCRCGLDPTLNGNRCSGIIGLRP